MILRSELFAYRFAVLTSFRQGDADYLLKSTHGKSRASIIHFLLWWDFFFCRRRFYFLARDWLWRVAFFSYWFSCERADCRRNGLISFVSCYARRDWLASERHNLIDIYRANVHTVSLGRSFFYLSLAKVFIYYALVVVVVVAASFMPIVQRNHAKNGEKKCRATANRNRVQSEKKSAFDLTAAHVKQLVWTWMRDA